MAKLKQITDSRLKNPDQYRLRYTIYFADGSRVDRSRRYTTAALARGKYELATVLENRTRQRKQTTEDIQIWKNERLISGQDADRLDLTPEVEKKTLEQALEEYRSTWEVSPEEAKTREGRIKVIKEVLGADTPIASLGYGAGEKLKAALKKRGKKGLKVVTIRKYFQDLKRCFRHQVRLEIIPHNPFTELSAGRVPAEEKIKQVKLTNDQVIEVLNKAEARIRKETDWRVLHGWLPVFLLMFFGTGLRRKEALLAKWEHIEWEARALRVPAENAKDKAERWIGLGQRLYNQLLLRRQEEGFILPRHYPTTVSKAIGRHFKKCGLEMRLHDTRHTYTTLLQEDAGARPDQVMQRTGHDDMGMLSQYTHPKFGEVLEDKFGFMQEKDEEETKH